MSLKLQNQIDQLKIDRDNTNKTIVKLATAVAEVVVENSKLKASIGKQLEENLAGHIEALFSEFELVAKNTDEDKLMVWSDTVTRPPMDKGVD